jgi:hypothetical protein
MYMTAKYPGKCSKTGRDILPGDRIIYYRSTRKAVLVSGTRSATFNDNGVSTTVYRNARGLCEDAPCCGCCTG